jgi:hypothetical protein
MTYFSHITEHTSECDCNFCLDVDPNKSISRELERCMEELTKFSMTELNDSQREVIDKIIRKTLLLRRYFPIQELPQKYHRLVKEELQQYYPNS